MGDLTLKTFSGQNMKKHLKKMLAGNYYDNEDNSGHISAYFNYSLLISLFLIFNFIIFLYSGNYPIMKNGFFSNEAIIIFLFITSFSFFLFFLVSFSKWLIRIIGCVIFAYILFCSLENYYVYSISDILSNITGVNFLPLNNFYLSIIITLFIFINTEKLFIQPITIVIIALLGSSVYFIYKNNYSAGNLFYSYSNDNKLITKDISYNSENPPLNFIYLMLNGHTSLANLIFEEKVGLRAPNSAPNKNENNSSYYNYISGFYNKYNFSLYPNLYAPANGSVFDSMAANLNYDKITDNTVKNPGEFISSPVVYGYTKSGIDSNIRKTLTNNSLFEMLKNMSFNINVYQSDDINFCEGAGKDKIYKCKIYITKFGNLSNNSMPVEEKIVVLLDLWLSSFKNFDNFALSIRKKIEKNLAIDLSEMPIIGNRVENISPLVQPIILDDLKKDILEAPANTSNAYFAYINLPGDTLVFDKYCKIKSVFGDWINIKNNKSIKRHVIERSYDEQLECLYGLLGDFFLSMEKYDKLLNTIFVIQGNTGSRIEIGNRPSNAENPYIASFDQFRSLFATQLAIKFLGQTFSYNNEYCDTATTFAKTLNKDKDLSCVRIQDLNNNIPATDKMIVPWLETNKKILDFNNSALDFEYFYDDWVNNKKFKINKVGYDKFSDVLDKIFLRKKNYKKEEPATKILLPLKTKKEEEIFSIEINNNPEENTLNQTNVNEKNIIKQTPQETLSLPSTNPQNINNTPSTEEFEIPEIPEEESLINIDDELNNYNPYGYY